MTRITYTTWRMEKGRHVWDRNATVAGTIVRETAGQVAVRTEEGVVATIRKARIVSREEL